MSEISCQNCQAACCVANTSMPLTRAEVKFMEHSGTELTTVLPASDKVSWSKTAKSWDESDDESL